MFRALLVLSMALWSACDSSTDEAEPLSDAGRDAGPDADVDSGGDEPRGVYAIKTVIDVAWDAEVDPPTIDPSAGVITLFHKVDVGDACDDGTLAAVEMTLCGITFPIFESGADCSAYQLEAREVSAWPSVEVELGNLGDIHRESACGVDTESPIEFRGLPTSSNAGALCDPSGAGSDGCPRAVGLSTRIQAPLSLDASLDVCTRREARTTEAVVVEALTVDIEACVDQRGMACSDNQVAYVDMVVPGLTVTGSRSAIAWLPDETGEIRCDAVRNAVDTAYPDVSF